MEKLVFDDLAVQGGDAVDAMAADDGQRGHSYAPLAVFFDDRHAAGPLVVVAEALPDLAEETLVDFINDLKMPGQDVAKEGDRPAFQCFGQDGVIGVAERARGDVPCLVPAEPFYIDQEPHQFRNGQGGMRVVELDGGLLGKAFKRLQPLALIVHPISLLVPADDVLKRGGDEEIFLLEPKLFSFEDVVVGIENLGDVLRQILRMHRADVIAGIEVAEVEFLGGAGAPEAQRVGGAVEISRDRRVIGNGIHVFRIDPLRHQTPRVVGELVDAAVIVNAHAIERAGDFPRVAVSEPGVGHLHLRAIDDALMKDSVIVADAIPIGGNLERRQRIHVAGGEPPQPAVAQAGIPFRLAQVFQFAAEVARGLGALFHQAEVDHAVAERPSHQEFQGHVIDALGVAGVIRLLRRDPSFQQPIANGQRQTDIGLPFAVDMSGQFGQRIWLQVMPHAACDGRGIRGKQGGEIVGNM